MAHSKSAGAQGAGGDYGFAVSHAGSYSGTDTERKPTIANAPSDPLTGLPFPGNQIPASRIDPGAALAPNRFGLPPADAEWEALKRANDRISGYAARANLIFLSHYHEDHFRYDPGLYAGRPLWAKDPKRHIAGRQALRAHQRRQDHR